MFIILLFPVSFYLFEKRAQGRSGGPCGARPQFRKSPGLSLRDVPRHSESIILETFRRISNASRNIANYEPRDYVCCQKGPTVKGHTEDRVAGLVRQRPSSSRSPRPFRIPILVLIYGGHKLDSRFIYERTFARSARSDDKVPVETALRIVSLSATPLKRLIARTPPRRERSSLLSRVAKFPFFPQPFFFFLPTSRKLKGSSGAQLGAFAITRMEFVPRGSRVCVNSAGLTRSE